MNLAESLLHAAHARGAREIFGIPGDFALPLFKVIEESGILPCYTLSHEPAVGFAADAAARLRGAPSIAAVTFGAGAFNVVNAIAAAYSEKSPVIVVSGGPGVADQSTGLLVHHQARHLKSQLEMYREVTCAQAVLDEPERAPDEIARVLDRCVEESRPVYLEVPRDRALAAAGPVPAPAERRRADPAALAACADEIAAHLERASSPVMMVGIEVRRFGLENAVAELAAHLGVPVVTSMMGRGLLANAPVPLRGTYMGMAGDPEVMALVEGSDALLLLGVLTADTNFGVSAQQIDLRHAVLATDGAVSLGYHIYPDVPLADLVSALGERAPRRERSKRVVDAPPVGLVADDAAIGPDDVARAVNDLFLREGAMPVAADMGDCLFTAMDFANTELVAPGYYATMGYGVPGGLGVQAATGRRPLIVVGDGAFQMTGWELLNCPRYGWDPIVLVFNNRSWEMLRAFQPESKFNDLGALDFAAIAEVLGGRGHPARTRRELQDALAAAAAERGRFQLVDIALERGRMSHTLERFVQGIGRMRARAAAGGAGPDEA